MSGRSVDPMTKPVDVRVFWNFRSPYCYLASKRIFDVLERYHLNLLWRPLGGWSGRSAPERAKKKVPLTRQDVRRFARRMGIPLEPPPKTTDPTRAGAASLLAEEQGLLRPWVVETMRAEWADGKDIGDPSVLQTVGEKIGLDRVALEHALEDPARLATLQRHWEEAESIGVMGVPTFVVGEDIFWGNDRIDFFEEHLLELRLAKL